MLVGKAWLVREGESLAESIIQASERYRQHFTRWPTAIWVGPGLAQIAPKGLKVVVRPDIGQSYTFLVGEEI